MVVNRFFEDPNKVAQMQGFLGGMGGGLLSGQGPLAIHSGLQGLLGAQANISAREAAELENQRKLLELQSLGMDVQSQGERFGVRGQIQQDFDPSTASVADLHRQASALAGPSAEMYNTLMNSYINMSPTAQNQLEVAKKSGQNLQSLIDGTIAPMPGALESEAARIGTEQTAQLAAAEPFTMREEDRADARLRAKEQRDQALKMEFEQFKNLLEQPGKERDALLQGIKTVNSLGTTMPLIQTRQSAESIAEAMQQVGDDGNITGTGKEIVLSNFSQMMRPFMRMRDDGTIPDDGVLDKLNNLVRRARTEGDTISPTILNEMWELSDKLYSNLINVHMDQARPVLDAFSDEFTPDQLMSVPTQNPFRYTLPNGETLRSGDGFEDNQGRRFQFIRGRLVEIQPLRSR